MCGHLCRIPWYQHTDQQHSHQTQSYKYNWNHLLDLCSQHWRRRSWERHTHWCLYSFDHLLRIHWKQGSTNRPVINRSVSFYIYLVYGSLTETSALKWTNSIVTNGIRVTVMISIFTFVFILTDKTSPETILACAVKTAIKVGTCSISRACISVVTLIIIRACSTVTGESTIACTCERPIYVGTGCVSVAIVWTTSGTFVDVRTTKAVSIESPTRWTCTRESTVEVVARSWRSTGSLFAFIDINTRYGIFYSVTPSVENVENLRLEFTKKAQWSIPEAPVFQPAWHSQTKLPSLSLQLALAPQGVPFWHSSTLSHVFVAVLTTNPSLQVTAEIELAECN